MKAKLILALILILLMNLDLALCQMSIQWAKKFNGSGGYNYNDRPKASVMDSKGNLIITGSSYDNSNSPYYYITVKYGPAGNILWTARLDTSSISGTPYNIAIDNNDNIYVSGGTSITGGQFTVVKYSPTGEIKWLVNETSPVDGSAGHSIVTDNNGNIYVTGPCAVGIDVDCLTVKYDSNGVRQWYSVYNHSSNNSDRPNKIILDNQNNVYIIGNTDVSGGGTLATTLKYNNSGNLLWAAIYDGAEYQDYLYDIDVDSIGNVYVTGSSNIVYSQNDYDFFTIKYNINGDSLWVKKFDGPGTGFNRSTDIPFSLSLDNENNLIVAGKSHEIDGLNDVRIIKYTNNGNEIWNNHFGFDSLSNDIAFSMEMDNEDNIYLAGKTNQDYMVLKYDSDGYAIWYNNYSGLSNGPYYSTLINVDQNNNPVLTGYNNDGATSEDYLSVKYDTSGSLIWDRHYSTSSVSNDFGNGLGADNQGNIIVTGKTESLNNKIDLITLKYNSHGNLVWSNPHNTLNSIYNEGIGIATDRYGNSFVTGYTTTSGQDKRLLTLKYDSSGVLKWTSIYSGTNDSISIPRKIIVDNDGNVYACGLTFINGHGYDLLVMKYNSLNGDTLWVKTFNNAYNGNEDGIDISVDNDNNVFITGYTAVSSNNTDYLLLKLDEKGNLIWFRTYNKLSSDIAYSVKNDMLGNVYITGRTYEYYPVPPYYYNIESYTATLKFDANGNLKWTSTNGMSCFSCPSENSAYDLILDDQFNVFVTGESTGKFKTIKYDSLGNSKWIKYYNGSYPGYSKATNIVMGKTNNIFVSGRSPSSQFNTDLTILKYNNETGSQDWIHTYNNNENRDDIISKMIIDSSGNIFITGYSSSAATGNDILILKYSDGTIGINSNTFFSDGFALSQNYPNPFNPKTIINYQLSASNGVNFISLKVYNALGKEISTLVNEKQNAGSYEVEFTAEGLPSGVYFYKLESGDFIETKRMILLK